MDDKNRPVVCIMIAYCNTCLYMFEAQKNESKPLAEIGTMAHSLENHRFYNLFY